MKYKRNSHQDFIEIVDQESLEKMLDLCGYFFDSVIVDIYYISGSSKTINNHLYPIDDLAELKITIHSQINKGMEIILLFENIIQLNLVPSDLKYDSLLGNPYFYINDDVLFSVIYPKDKINYETSKENTWIKSKYLKYKIIKH